MAKPIQLQMPGRPAGAQAETPPPAGPGILFAAPHRPMFLAGAAQTVLAFLPWVWELLARNGLLAGPAWPWPPGWVHGLWALYGVFPFFVFGFLMTAMPRWQGMPDTPGSAARLPWLCLVGGWLVFDAGLLLPPHYHTGIVIGHTVKGAWRYIENNWISRAGDTVYEVAGSSHTPESLDDTEVFFFIVGELLFFDADGKTVLWQENHKTSLERYNSYCEANGITPRDLTDWSE